MNTMADPLEVPRQERVRRWRIRRSKARNQQNKKVVDTIMFWVYMGLTAALAITIYSVYVY